MSTTHRPSIVLTNRVRLCLTVGLLVALLWLSGCATAYRLSHTVDTHTAWATDALPAAGDTFAFDRLPSQQAEPQAAFRQQLENAALAVLSHHGLQLAAEPHSARWTLQLTWRQQRTWRDLWHDPFFPGPFWGMLGRDYVVTGTGQVIWLPAMHHAPTAHYERELKVLLRDARTGQVVFESTATQESPWHDNPALVSALMEAAFDGFPQPSVGQRQVVIEKPRRPAVTE